MYDDSKIKEKLELLKKYVYEEIHLLKDRIVEENTPVERLCTSAGKVDGQKSGSYSKFNKLKRHHRSSTKLHRHVLNRKYKLK